MILSHNRNPLIGIFSAAKRRGSLFVLLLLCLTAGFVSCGKEEKGASSPLLDEVENLSSVKSGDDLSRFYTRDTIRAARAYASKNGGTDLLAGMDRKIFVKGSRWIVIRQSENGGQGVVELRITEHPAPNMIGLMVSIPLRFEDNVWKIDRVSAIESLSR
jgi:hypothetical protein